MSRYRTVDDLRADYPVTRLCRLLEVSTSGFYAWKQRGPSARAIADAELVTAIRDLHVASRGTYDAPRIHGQLARGGPGWDENVSPG